MILWFSFVVQKLFLFKKILNWPVLDLSWSMQTLSYLLFLAVLGLLHHDAWALCCCTQTLFSCSKQRLLSSSSVKASSIGGFPCCGAHGLQQLWCLGAIVQVCGLICPMACGIFVSRPGIKSMSPALAGRFLTPGPPG